MSDRSMSALPAQELALDSPDGRQPRAEPLRRHCRLLRLPSPGEAGRRDPIRHAERMQPRGSTDHLPLSWQDDAAAPPAILPHGGGRSARRLLQRVRAPGRVARCVNLQRRQSRGDLLGQGPAPHIYRRAWYTSLTAL